MLLFTVAITGRRQNVRGAVSSSIIVVQVGVGMQSINRVSAWRVRRNASGCVRLPTKDRIRTLDNRMQNLILRTCDCIGTTNVGNY